MPEPTDEELGIPEGLDPHIRDELRKSRQLRGELEAANAVASAAQREAAFAKAGIPDTPLAAALASTYTGENDPAAIKAYFEGLGVSAEAPAAPAPGNVGTPEAVEEDRRIQAELDQQRQVSGLGAPGSPDGSVRLEDAIRSAKNADEVMAIVAAAPETATGVEGRRIVAPRVD